tara:strand:+ start:340 stop:534 length:195 start_codon:yes stop_codon:yes gene_type:complete
MIIIENINEFVGRVPAGHELVVMEKGDPSTAMTLFGFDELGMFDHEFENPQYGFINFVNPLEVS